MDLHACSMCVCVRVVCVCVGGVLTVCYISQPDGADSYCGLGNLPAVYFMLNVMDLHTARCITVPHPSQSALPMEPRCTMAVKYHQANPR